MTDKIQTPKDLIERLRDKLSGLISESLSDLKDLETLEIETPEDPIMGQYGILDLETAKTLDLGDLLYHLTYNNADQTPQRYKVNGRPQLWKTRPEEIRIPVKRGLYQYDQVWHYDLDQFSLSEVFASQDHDKKTDLDRLSSRLRSDTNSLQSFCIMIGDQIRDFESDSGHSYLRPETLTEDQTEDLETLSRVSRSLSLFLRKIRSDLQYLKDLKDSKSDPERLSLKTLRSSQVFLSDLYSDPEIWSQTGDDLRELTLDLVSGLFQVWTLFDRMTPKTKRERRPSKSEDLIKLIKLIEDKKIETVSKI